MKKIKSKFFMSLLLACVMFFTISLSGCMGIISNVIIDLFNIEEKYPEYESGDWRYAVRKNKDGTKEGYLIGFTEEGKQKECVVLPTELGGVTIVGICYRYRTSMMSASQVGKIESDCLKRIYVPNAYTYTKMNYANVVDLLPVDCLQIVWQDPDVNTGWVVQIFLDNSYIYADNICRAKGEKWRYKGYVANVSYMYNYDNAPNDGYYWADNYENDLIKYIPPEPKREGYTFGGWYKDKECTEKWDFENDKTGDNIQYVFGYQYTGTYLYAKWMENT